MKIAENLHELMNRRSTRTEKERGWVGIDMLFSDVGVISQVIDKLHRKPLPTKTSSIDLLTN